MCYLKRVKRRRINNVLDKCNLLWHYLNQTDDGGKGYSMGKDYKRFRSEVRKGLFMKLDINVEGVRTEKDLEERILRAIEKY